MNSESSLGTVYISDHAESAEEHYTDIVAGW